MNGIQLELCEPYFIDASIMKRTEYTLMRLDNRGKRIYYRLVNNEPRIYTGVTSMIKATMPTSPQLIEWYKKNGSNSEDMTNEAADYGTLMHILAQKILVTGEYDFQNLTDDMKAYATDEGLDIKSFVNHAYTKIQYDLLAFCQWVLDYKVTPIAIEQVLCSDERGTAGAIDLVCQLTLTEKGFDGTVYKSGPQKGAKKEVKIEKTCIAIVDFKSGRKGFWESHEIQLKEYQELVQENYPDLKVEKLFNWSPKEWKTGPSYNFKDQTDCKSQRKLPHLIQLYKMDNNDAARKILVFDDKIDLKAGNPGGFRELSYHDYIKLHARKD